MWRAIEQVETNGVTDSPVVEVLAPAIHLRRCYALRIIEECCHHAGIKPAGFPERQGEIVISPETFSHGLHFADRHAKCFGDVDAVSRQAFAVTLTAKTLKRCKHRLDLLVEVRGLCTSSSDRALGLRGPARGTARFAHAVFPSCLADDNSCSSLS